MTMKKGQAFQLALGIKAGSWLCLLCLCVLFIVTGGDLGSGEDDVLNGLAVLLVGLWLKETLHGDAVALFQKVDVCCIIIAAPDLDVEDCAGALLVLILALRADDCQAESGY